MPTCAREFRPCGRPAGGFHGKLLHLCATCAQIRLRAIALGRKQRRRSLLGVGR